MKWKCILAGLTLVISCQTTETYKKADDAEEAGTSFIRASLDGNFEKAKFYLYQDSTGFNVRALDKWKAEYAAMDKDEKGKYHSADIRPTKIEPTPDSSYSYTYYNSYKRDTTTIRIFKVNGDWLVDLRELH